jgi:hypothetical protein
MFRKDDGKAAGAINAALNQLPEKIGCHLGANFALCPP